MTTDTTDLKATPLKALHMELGARMVPFAGYDMPVQYPEGIKTEHLHTREHAGLFDVSHMGQVVITGEGVAAAVAVTRRTPPLPRVGRAAGSFTTSPEPLKSTRARNSPSTRAHLPPMIVPSRTRGSLSRSRATRSQNTAA